MGISQHRTETGTFERNFGLAERWDIHCFYRAVLEGLESFGCKLVHSSHVI